MGLVPFATFADRRVALWFIERLSLSFPKRQIEDVRVVTLIQKVTPEKYCCGADQHSALVFVR